MEQREILDTILRDAHTVLPLVITGLSIVFLSYKRYKSRKYPSNAENEELIISLRKRRAVLICLSGFEALGWLYHFIQNTLNSENQTVYGTLTLTTLFITWFTLFILSITSPVRNHYKDRAYNYIFTFIYFYLFLESCYKLLVIDPVSYWDISYSVITGILFLVTGTTSQPFHPRDLQTVSYEKFEIKNHTVYRNDLALSPEATASIISWATFQWMNPLVVFGFRNVVTRENIYALTFQHMSRYAFEDFINTKEIIASTKILYRIYSCNKKEIWIQFTFAMSSCLINYLGPFFQQKFLQYVELKDDRPPIQVAYLYVLGLFTVGVVKALCDTVHLWASRRWNIRTLSMLDSEIFSKTLKRKDMSGRVSGEEEKDEEEDDSDDKKDKDGKKKEEAAQSFSNVGKITNLMSVDADKLSDIPAYLHMIYSAPVDVIISIAYLYQLLGVSTLVGLAVMLVCLPLSGLVTKKMSAKYTELTTAKDRRNELVNEVLQGIRMIKYFAWENNWKERVSKARKVEIKKLISVIVLDICIGLIYTVVPVFVIASTFIWYTKVAGNELTASVAFVSITLFDMLRNPLIFIPESINTFTEAYVSLKRISNYLQEPEVSENINSEPLDIPFDISPQAFLARVGFEDSVFQYHVDSDSDAVVASDESTSSSSSATAQPKAKSNFQLTVPKFTFPTGKLSLICGPTGSGKSSFLSALLGELDIVSGRTYLPSKVVLNAKNISTIDPDYPNLILNKVAYVAQQPFLRHASIRENILFGLPFDEERYKKTLYQCALIKDLTILPDGDRTEIGEKGISLSGGQKQRVSLARAVYSNAKTVLLDDCLSAVDAHTSKHIYKKCLLGDLLKGRTVILVTHQVRLCLPGAHFFIKIENGNALGCDTVANLRASGALAKFIGSEGENEETTLEIDDEIEEVADDDDSAKSIDLDAKNEAQKLVQEESSEQGQVKIKVYLTYLAACGGWIFWGVLLGSYVISRLLGFAENWWLRIWASAYDNADPTISLLAYETSQNSTAIPHIRGMLDTAGAAIYKQNIFRNWVFEEKQPINVDYYIAIYILISLISVAVMILKNIFTYWGSIRGARTLFDGLLNRIIHAPLRFYDTTPVGRILNRFGKDVTTVDLQIARSWSFLVDCTTGIAASTIVICAITPQFFVVAIAVSCLYFLIGVYYLRISRELKRLNSVSRSPIYSHFTESLVGVTTIRAYGVEEQFMRTVFEKIDSFVAPFYYLWMSNRWLYARIEFTGAFVSFFTGIFLILNIKSIDAGMAGIALFYARSFLENIYWFIRQYTQVEMNLNSVERVIEYIEIEQEPPAIIEGSRPPAAWPTTAAIEVNDLVIRYAPELDPVLHGVSFSTRPYEKIGIVGRTGSGKSTMALSFFRFLEASSGSISIDGIDISKIGLQDLRTQMTIIPQDAILFSGTIRSNLDPFKEHTDEEIWESLERAHLVKTTDRLKASLSGASTPRTSGSGALDEEQQSSAIKSLNQQVSDGGNNFSQGQRQLLCLARALLKNSKLIIMDEATASVDFDTDAKIQATIREEFVNSTLLCIAHRLRTVIDYDRILVLDQGRVVEFDTPYNLVVENTGAGVFKSMCEKSGELEVLLKMATEAHQNRDIVNITPDNHSLSY